MTTFCTYCKLRKRTNFFFFFLNGEDKNSDLVPLSAIVHKRPWLLRKSFHTIVLGFSSILKFFYPVFLCHCVPWSKFHKLFLIQVTVKGFISYIHVFLSHYISFLLFSLGEKGQGVSIAKTWNINASQPTWNVILSANDNHTQWQNMLPRDVLWNSKVMQNREEKQKK